MRHDLGALTTMIELEQKAWLNDLQQVAALLQPTARPENKATAVKQYADANGDHSGSSDSDDNDDNDDESD